MTKRTDHYARALVDATYITDKLAEAEKRMMDARPGLPGAQAFDSPSVSGGASGGPVEAALNLTGGTEESDANWQHPQDQARADIKAMDTAIREINKHAAILRRLVDAYTPHAATGKDKAAAERANELDPECRHCREGADVFEPFRTTTDVGGILPAAVPLCRWHADFTARTKRPATARETDMHHQGRTIRLPA